MRRITSLVLPIKSDHNFLKDVEENFSLNGKEKSSGEK
jgi:hypothetical protein